MQLEEQVQHPVVPVIRAVPLAKGYSGVASFLYLGYNTSAFSLVCNITAKEIRINIDQLLCRSEFTVCLGYRTSAQTAESSLVVLYSSSVL